MYDPGQPDPTITTQWTIQQRERFQRAKDAMKANHRKRHLPATTRATGVESDVGGPPRLKVEWTQPEESALQLYLSWVETKVPYLLLDREKSGETIRRALSHYDAKKRCRRRFDTYRLGDCDDFIQEACVGVLEGASNWKAENQDSPLPVFDGGALGLFIFHRIMKICDEARKTEGGGKSLMTFKQKKQKWLERNVCASLSTFTQPLSDMDKMDTADIRRLDVFTQMVPRWSPKQAKAEAIAKRIVSRLAGTCTGSLVIEYLRSRLPIKAKRLQFYEAMRALDAKWKRRKRSTKQLRRVLEKEIASLNSRLKKELGVEAIDGLLAGPELFDFEVANAA